MARVTIENCLKKVDGHFDLVLLAGERAKQISAGRKSSIQKKGVKTHVTSLREIEESVVSVGVLRENLHDRINHLIEVEESKEENDDLVEELQSSEFIEGELELISDSDNFFTHPTKDDEEVDIDFGEEGEK
ncbi:MAG: DNA-directed RNA polymerase subunit omega [Alphaproteobacteria bacterium]|jgi:DNA-directed RNA polymerase subunit omega|nr:DNA-directed RNA polymerase subunit omega [Alphaproteobacteria bacterium]